MIFISHRGNINGINSELENTPEYIQIALNKGFDVEIDVHYKDGLFFLGHDEPKYEVDFYFLEQRRLWLHAKTIDSLYTLIQNPHIHCFYHDSDAVTLTSQGYIWTHCDNLNMTPESICVLPERHNIEKEIPRCAGICSDYIEKYRNRDLCFV